MAALLITDHTATKYEYDLQTEELTTIDLVNQARSAHVKFIHVYFVDIPGNLHELIIPFRQFESALVDGLKFDGSSIPGYSNIYDSDMHLTLDYESFFVNPSVKNQPQTARIFADVQQTAGHTYNADPRFLLKQAEKKARNLGYKLHVGPEIEFFLLQEKSPGNFDVWDKNGYFDAEYDQKHATIKFEIMQTLLDHGVIIEKLHHEVAPGQHEFSIRYTTPVNMADQIILAKYLIQQIARKHGLLATFMPKPFYGMNGSGMHIHFSLADADTSWNLFHDDEDQYHLSPLAQRFIAGVLRNVEAGAAILNSSINSYKRLVPGYEAPIYICWSLKNRSALIRIPLTNENQPEATRAEIRCTDALCNPYLACTFILEAGLQGILQDLTLEAPQNENLFKLNLQEILDRNINMLPSSLEKALSNFLESSTMAEIFNKQLINQYHKIKIHDVFSFNTTITNWEQNRYMQ